MDLRERVNSIPWYQSIDLGNGLITPGRKSLELMRHEQNVFFDPVRLDGATVLDIGAWAGAHSFEAKRRGAKRVMAADQYVWTHPHWRGREAFELARSATGCDVEAREIDVLDIKPEALGKWDVVLFAGVLYHLRSPLDGLQAAASVAEDCLIVESEAATKFLESPAPLLIYHPSGSLRNDATNYFTPNVAFVVEALKECGFKLFDTNVDGRRLTVHAWRNTARRAQGDLSAARSRKTFSIWRRALSRLRHEARAR